ncbi:diacylglycerol kinase [Glaciecola sp. SC05]|uniref:diacylglycerol kinase n=1 Tax=Glaciecola sp. SC05 TaxID=1987355 RepID=UPI003526F55D
MFNPTNKHTGIKRIYLAGKNSLNALHWLFKNEAAFKQEVGLLIAAAILSTLIAQTALERLMLILSVVLILLLEIVNTAIEVVVDRIGLDIHPLSGLAKDLGSLLVLVGISMAAAVWLVTGFTNWG